MSGWTNVTPPFTRPPRRRYERWEFDGEMRNGVMPSRMQLSLMDGVWRVSIDGLDSGAPLEVADGAPFSEVVEAALKCVAKLLHSVCGEVTEALEQARKVTP